MKGLITVISFFMLVPLSAQNLGEDLKSVFETSKASKQFALRVDYHTASANEPEKSAMAGSIIMVKKDSIYYSKQADDTEFYTDGKYSVVVDNSHKNILMDYSADRYIGKPTQQLNELLKFVEPATKVSAYKEANGRIRYLIQYDSGELDSMIIVLNKKKSELIEESVYYRKPIANKISVHMRFSYVPVGSFAAKLKLSAFFTKVNGRFAPVAKYQSYTLLNAPKQ